MRLLMFLEFVFTIFFIVFMLTQVIWPLLAKTQLFWLFRKAPQKDIDRLQAALATEDAKAEADRLREELDERLKRNADNIRRRYPDIQSSDAGTRTDRTTDESEPVRPNRRRVVVSRSRQ